ncbi:hypothetical protein [Streptomyces virginiae]|uniref:hypothetical protein n=1 Tax=Streptomyces virginiae TaxID=1961 RepID=UPI0022513A6D|nr:hypothetical protein [Streptomyces virginiae]MCX5275397.1 hypothetical protein [Streptomyces virginiae]
MDVMNDGNESAGRPPVQSRLERLRQSARGWQKAQLAVLGATALFGVLKSRTVSYAPREVQLASGVLLLLALGIACWAALLVGRVAWSLPGGNTPSRRHRGEEAELWQASRGLGRGRLLTYVAIALAALATASQWWPSLA